MLESITRKLGMTIEEYAQRFHDYIEKTELTEDDNPIPGLPDLGVLSREETLFMGNYVTVNNL